LVIERSLQPKYVDERQFIKGLAAVRAIFLPPIRQIQRAFAAPLSPADVPVGTKQHGGFVLLPRGGLNIPEVIMAKFRQIRTLVAAIRIANVPYYNFGICSGCVQSGPASPTTPADNGWVLSDFYRLSWQLDAAWPLPEIYATQGENAKQWQVVADVGKTQIGGGTKGALMLFRGAVTQLEACYAPPKSCPSTDNTPGGGWMQLNRYLNADPDTAQTLPDFVTDFTWVPW
jgi:hypothetical protein